MSLGLSILKRGHLLVIQTISNSLRERSGDERHGPTSLRFSSCLVSFASKMATLMCVSKVKHQIGGQTD